LFEQRVLPVTEEIMFKWRLLVEDGRKAGYTVVTRNVSEKSFVASGDLTGQALISAM